MAESETHRDGVEALASEKERIFSTSRSKERSTLRNAFAPVEKLYEPGLAPRSHIREAFHRIWGRLEEEVDVDLTSDEALNSVRDLVIYDIPDGTRSTLTVPLDMDVGTDASMYCLAFLHTLHSLGAQRCVFMTHTAYNRQRGQEGLGRILGILSEGIEPFAAYATKNNINVDLAGMGEDYELKVPLLRAFPKVANPSFDAHFLVDYREELFLTEEGRRLLANLPNIDVCIRHTKFNISGGWIPTKMHRASFLYCQNGTLYSNWTYDEYVAMVAIALLAKRFSAGEGLVKMYGDIDEVKRRYQLRELKLFQKVAKLQERPRKLFVAGSPLGIYQFYY